MSFFGAVSCPPNLNCSTFIGLCFVPQEPYEEVSPEQRPQRTALAASRAYLEAKACGNDLAARRLAPLIETFRGCDASLICFFILL